MTITKDMLFYDCEIVNCINPIEGYTSCDGWHDYKGMGISVIGTYCLEGGYHAYLFEDIFSFQALVDCHSEIIGFNSRNFDDLLLQANGVAINTTYDLLEEIRFASGQPRKYTYGKTRGGYSLDCLARENLLFGKSGNGMLAPVLWQQGKKQEVIDYCLKDVEIMVLLFEKKSALIDPTNGSILECAKSITEITADVYAN